MSRIDPRIVVSALWALVALITPPLRAQESSMPTSAPALGAAAALGTAAHEEYVMTSTSCAQCHPAIYAEHSQNTHGRAFFDAEARAATRSFRRDDCVRCHTPRPVFETGIGLTPMQRYSDLEEGNTCMSCHWKEGVDYSRFTGGAECRSAFDPRVGSVQACASCHRIGGTPDQYSRAEHGKLAGRVCIDCHMPVVVRPVAVGEAPKSVHAHTFPASHSESQLRRAYAYDAKIDGDHVVVKITNKGAGHNFPTASRQRAVESVITVRDENGIVVGTSRLVCRYPYAVELEPKQMTMPVSTQIPSGKSREHRVPITVTRGTIECELFFKLYRPIDDYHDGLSHRLEDIRIPFTDVTASSEKIEDAPYIGFPAPPASLEDYFSPAGFANVARPAPSSRPVEVPRGENSEDVLRLVSMLEFHMPEVRDRARAKLEELGPTAIPSLIDALGAWSNETTNQAMDLLTSIGEPAIDLLHAALTRPEIYVRVDARLVLGRITATAGRQDVMLDLERGLSAPGALDRRSTIEALTMLGDSSAAPRIQALLEDRDPDVVIAAAKSLASFDTRAAAPLVKKALARAMTVESRREIARALCELGDASGARVLLDDLSAADELTRTNTFDAFFAATGMHASYDPGLPDTVRLESLAHLHGAWEEFGGEKMLRPHHEVDPAIDAHAKHLIENLGGGSDTAPAGNDPKIMDELTAMGEDAVPALIDGLTYPSGWATKRARVCEVLGRLKARDAVPSLVRVLRDPYLFVTDWACLALEQIGDKDVLPALVRFEARVTALKADKEQEDTAERLLARIARTRFMLGDDRAKKTLVFMLLSPSRAARESAIVTLAETNGGDRRGYDPEAAPADRIAAATRWMN